MILFISAVLLALLSIIAFYRSHMQLTALLIFASTFCVRSYFNMQDPYLHDWDERYHALVAKNMITDPFTPILRKDAVLSYDYKAWCCNHIWVHKQPLFMWQMALSMKIFGVNVFALRLPSAILCGIIAMVIFRMGILLKKNVAGFTAALFFAFSFFSIEQGSGAIGMDHNDLAMGAYVLLSIWCLLEYFHSGEKNWIYLIGIFAGLSILVKWLLGLLVYACWGLCIILTDIKQFRKEALRLCISLCVACVIFIPWQLYIAYRFPLETKQEYEFNRRHITEALENHSGGANYYLTKFQDHYALFAIPLLVFGLLFLLRSKILMKYKIVIISSILIIYLFFSFIVLTKSPGYVYLVAPFVLLIMGLCYEYIHDLLKKRLRPVFSFIITAALIVVSCSVFLQYNRLHAFYEYGRSDYNWENHENKLHNTAIYKQLDSILDGQYVVFNCNAMEDVEAMFFSDQNVYSWYPEESTYDSLRSSGCKIAAFKDHGKYLLPYYIVNDPDIVIIDAELR